MIRFRTARAVVPFALALLSFTAAHAQSSRKQERERAEKMAKLDAEIERRRQEAPIPEEGTVDMNGVDLHKKRQLEIVEARLGNTSLGAAEKDKQYESTTSRGFTVRKFKQAKGAPKQEKGYTPPARGIDPDGKPLVHNSRKKHFLFF